MPQEFLIFARLPQNFSQGPSMDDPSMNHVLGASDVSEDLHEADNAAPAKISVFRQYAWQTYVRCLFLLAILATIGAMSWRPGLIRLSLLLSSVSPSQGDSLAWQPDNDRAPRLAPRRQIQPPDEWRLAADPGDAWGDQAPGAADTPHWQGGSLPVSPWKRLSVDTWSWQDDHEYGMRRRQSDPLAQPSQKSATGFRADDADGWGTVTIISESAETSPESSATAPLPSPTSGGIISLEPLSLDALDYPASREVAAPSSRPEPAGPASPGGAAEPENVDWKNREIADRIPGAFLTIYPRLKFVGLCVPGQGYIRKYNQVGVPRDLATRPKLAADDGRTPYGKYYVAGRSRDADGVRLLLSWPSPEDVRRLGAPAEVVTEVEMAWLDRILPPQTTMAGGGVALTGRRQWLENTEGGFALEEPHMEEIYTALPEGAWVFIQDDN
jgi:hypothetical protein